MKGVDIVIWEVSYSEKYIEVGLADKELLAKLVEEAKGKDRSIRKFAQDVGVNASTISRILNQKITNHVDEKILKSISENSAEGSNVTFDKLMEANGMQPPQKARIFTFMGQDFTTRCWIALSNYSKSHHLNLEIQPSTYKAFDYMVTTEKGCWLIECKKFNSVASSQQLRSILYTNILNGFRKDVPDFKKISIAIDNKDAFELMKGMLNEFRLPFEFSVILIGNFTILDEAFIEVEKERKN